MGMKIILVCSALLFALPLSFGFASTGISTGYEFGERGIVELLEDRDTLGIFDSKARDYKLTLDLPLPNSTEAGFALGHKENRYKNSPASEYNRDTFTVELKRRLSEMLALGLEAGIADYDYREIGRASCRGRG